MLSSETDADFRPLNVMVNFKAGLSAASVPLKLIGKYCEVEIGPVLYTSPPRSIDMEEMTSEPPGILIQRSARRTYDCPADPCRNCTIPAELWIYCKLPL